MLVTTDVCKCYTNKCKKKKETRGQNLWPGTYYTIDRAYLRRFEKPSSGHNSTAKAKDITRDRIQIQNDEQIKIVTNILLFPIHGE